MPSKKIKRTDEYVIDKGKGKQLPVWFLELPLEIYWELCSFLDPPDLISLARVSKCIRSFLTNPTSARIWKDAVERFRVLRKLPPCPPYFSEPKFFHLVFNNMCRGCGINNCDSVMWPFRTRYCNNCVDIFTTSTPTSVVPVKLRNDEDIVWYNVVPNCRHKGRRRWLLSDLDEFSQQFRRVRLETRHRVINEWKQYTEEMKKAAFHCSEWMEEMARWTQQMGQAERWRLIEMKLNRLHAIIEHLKGFGWEAELKPTDHTPSGSLAQLPEVDQPTELTTQEWENMFPTFAKIMEGRKARRLNRERCSLLTSRFTILQEALRQFRHSHLTRRDLRPRVIDICLDQKVRNLVDVGANKISSQDLREQLLSCFPDVYARWRETIESRLLEWASAYIGYSKGVNPSELALFVVRCSTCGDVFWYPAILAHKCLSAILPPRSYTSSAAYEDVAIQKCARYPFSLNVLDQETRSGTTNVIQICGLDPKVATCYDMDQADTRLTCKICNENGRRKIMTWRTALNHSINGCCRQPLDPGVNNWERVSEEEVSKAKKLESSAARAAATHRPATRKKKKNWAWTCDRCDQNSFKNRKHFLIHFRNEHTTKPPVRHNDYYRELVASRPPVEPVLLLSDTARLRPWERMWLLDGRAALHHYGSA